MSKTDQQQIDFNHDLNERTKDPRYLYGIFKLFNKTDVPSEKIQQEVVDLTPGGKWIEIS